MSKRTSRNRYSFYENKKGSNHSIRIYRANDWDKAVMGAIQQRIRSNPEKGKILLDMLWNEFGTIMIATDKDKAFLRYAFLLSQKPFGQLGVNVKGNSIIDF